MSKIDALIEELCPEGVQTLPLRKLLSRRKGISITAQKMKTLHSGDRAVRVFAGGRTLVDVDSNEFETASLIGGPAIIVKSRGIIEFAFWEGLFTHKNELWSYTATEPKVDIKFVYYYLESKSEFFVALAKSKSVKMPQLSVGDTDDYELPVPPIEVQREIVSILDKFTQLEAELEAELEARRIQYEVTRDRLLDFRGDLDGHPLNSRMTMPDSETVRVVKLANLATTQTPAGKIPRSKFQYEGLFPVIDQSQSAIAGYTDDVSLVNEFEPCVVFGDHTREIKYVDFPFVAGADGTVILIPSNELSSKFLFYSMQTLRIQSRGYNRHWSVVKDLEIAIPEMSAQSQIVEILDKLDSLVNDITIGLPAEIADRRKQYEYYRNKLLTFKELEAA